MPVCVAQLFWLLLPVLLTWPVVGCAPQTKNAPTTPQTSPSTSNTTASSQSTSSESDVTGERDKTVSSGGSAAATAAELAAERARLDDSTWASEVEAQRHEQVFIRLWDRLRQATNGLEVLATLPFDSLDIAEVSANRQLDLDIREIVFDGLAKAIPRDDWGTKIRAFARDGLRLEQSEWHHSQFVRDQTGNESVVDFGLYLLQGDAESPDAQRLLLKGKLHVKWKPGTGDPELGALRVADLTARIRKGRPPFVKAFTYERRSHDVASAHPIILADLDGNGYDEIVISRWNRIYWNEGAGKFREGVLLDHFVPLMESAAVGDFTGDGHADLVTVTKEANLVLFRGTADGRFPDAAAVASDVKITDASAMTFGDPDGDGDLDLWVTQYKPSYLEGQMPTPYYDAQDGEPSFYLRNRGDGTFEDVTEEVGLAAKRRRRTYSSSFLDLDRDGHLDLVVVSDYAGVDYYKNDGSGHFHDVTDQIFDNRHLFGMAHTVGDYNLDGQLDLYAIGMSSTTARRLDGMQLGRADRADIHQMRSAMGYGNRMYLFDGDRFQAPSFAAQVARTGWSWGTTSFDFDRDGDQDIYVANGFRSGSSCEDYCTTFWRHDIYTGTSSPDREVATLFTDVMRDLNRGAISWNGYEHNAMLLNLDGQAFANAAYLLGVGFEFDSRAVVSNDLDGDGVARSAHNRVRIRAARIHHEVARLSESTRDRPALG